jgi:hypothetical protein
MTRAFHFLIVYLKEASVNRRWSFVTYPILGLHIKRASHYTHQFIYIPSVEFNILTPTKSAVRPEIGANYKYFIISFQKY